MLDRVGGEVARATSIVRYRAGSQFSEHVHGGGEEFFVLEGVFQDEHGEYPVGTYVRNPPQSRHTPGSAVGCTIFVKLWQFDPADRRAVVVDTSTRQFSRMMRRNVLVMLLHSDDVEEVCLERWPPTSEIAIDLPGGGEFMVLQGGFSEQEEFEEQSWLRLPAESTFRARVGSKGCTVWVKTGHLRRLPDLPIS